MRKSHFHCFSSFQKRHLWWTKRWYESCSETCLWHDNMVSNLLTFSQWKVVFSIISFYIGLFRILCTWENSSFAKEEGLHHKMYKTKTCSLLWCRSKSGCGNWKFQFLFVCLFTFLFVPHVLPISQKENGPIMISKTVLKSGLWRRSESGCGIFKLKLLVFSLHSIVEGFEGLKGFERFERFEGLRGLKVVWINLNKSQHNWITG